MNYSTEQIRKMTGAVLGPLCAIILWLMPIDGLSEQAHHLLAVMSLIAIWWITEPIAIPLTSLFGPTLCVILGIVPIKDAYEQFANPMIFLFMGGFLLAKGLWHHVHEMGWRLPKAHLLSYRTCVYPLFRMGKQYCYGGYDVSYFLRTVGGYSRDDG